MPSGGIAVGLAGALSDPKWRVTIMGDSTWYVKTSRRRPEAKKKLEHTPAILIKRIVELGACELSLDFQTSEQLAKKGWACAGWPTVVEKLKATPGWSPQDRLLIWVGSGNSWVK